jgi:hypothetical protein
LCRAAGLCEFTGTVVDRQPVLPCAVGGQGGMARAAGDKKTVNDSFMHQIEVFAHDQKA